MERGISKRLGKNLLGIRQRRGLSQENLSKLAKIPRSTIANFESGDGNPTLSHLNRISQALQIQIEELISQPKADLEHYPKGSLPIKKVGIKKEVTLHKLLPDFIPGSDIERFVMPKKSVLKGVPHQRGAREYLYCEKGVIQLIVSGEVFELESGDVAVFQGDQPHSYKNIGQLEAIGFSVILL